MSAEYLKKAHGRMITDARKNLRHRVQYFILRSNIDADEKRLSDHAAVVEGAANFLHAVSLTKRFKWEENGKAQRVIGRINGDSFFLSSAIQGEGTVYRAEINDATVSPECAKLLWNTLGVPTRRRHVTAKLLESRKPQAIK